MSVLNLLRTPFFGTAYSFQVLGVATAGLWLSPGTAALAGVVHALIEGIALLSLRQIDPSSSEFIYRQAHFGFAVGAIIATPLISILNRRLPQRSKLLALVIVVFPVSMAVLFFIRSDFSAIYLLTMARNGHRGLLAADTGSRTFTLYLLVYALAGLLVIIQYLRHIERARAINLCLAGLLLQYIAGGVGYFVAQSHASAAEWPGFDPLLAKASLLICVVLRIPADVLSLTILAALLPRPPISPARIREDQPLPVSLPRPS